MDKIGGCMLCCKRIHLELQFNFITMASTSGKANGKKDALRRNFQSAKRQLNLQQQFMHNWMTGQSNTCLRTVKRKKQRKPEESSFFGRDNLMKETSLVECAVGFQSEAIKETNPKESPVAIPSQVLHSFDAIIGHREHSGQIQVLIKWTKNDDGRLWKPSWEPLGNISEDEEEACREHAKEHNLLEEWFEHV